MIFLFIFYYLIIIISANIDRTNRNLIEDITKLQDDANDDNLEIFPTPPPIETTTTFEKSQNYQIYNEKDLYQPINSNPYAKKKQPNSSEIKVRESRQPLNSQIVAGIPDLSDPCFRRYENSIIVNAQPYERRSSTSLIYCKSHCLSSQIGVYNCRSFVYDNVNQVCDLFAHVGDHAPARLLKFQTRDYYEPTNAVQCLDIATPQFPSSPSFSSSSSSSSSSLFSDDFGAPPSMPEHSIALTSKTDQRENVEATTTTTTTTTTTQKSIDNHSTDCPNGKLPAFLRTEGFELFKHDDEQMIVTSPQECANVCKSNNINGNPLKCKSFDFLTSTFMCSFTSEAAVPVGNGQLKQRDDASYHEKICVSSNFIEQCPASFFSRFPQMILVGFAESVTDSPNFDHCFDTCLNSFQLFGFNCTSGMYYFEESQLNCILNSENRNTQKELFAEENTDIVDYFEVECEKTSVTSRMLGVRNFETEAIGAEKMMISEYQKGDVEEEENGSKWESWSECVDGKQTRRKSCLNFNKIENCAEEVRDCQKPGAIKMSIRKSRVGLQQSEQIPTKQEIAHVKSTIKKHGFNCALNKCCRVFESCSFGLRHNSHTKQLEWCRRSCEEEDEGGEEDNEEQLNQHQKSSIFTNNNFRHRLL